MILGLTGGSGSGKSTAAKLFAEHGALTIDADVVYRELLQSNRQLLAELAKVFGSDILLPDGSLDRKKLGAIVFSDKLKLLMLNKITHKYITEKILNIITNEGHKHPFTVIDAAILFESGMADECDATVAITAPDNIRIQRICKRDGITETEAQKRISAQMPQKEMAARADFVIDTKNGIEELREMVGKIAARLSEGGK